jgi:hypothetical protein
MIRKSENRFSEQDHASSKYLELQSMQFEMIALYWGVQ